jgi:hypothetical protein
MNLTKKEVTNINKGNKQLALMLSNLIGMKVSYGYSHSPNRYVSGYDGMEGFYTGVRRKCSLGFYDAGITVEFNSLLSDYYDHENPEEDFGLFTIENVLVYFDHNKTYRSHSFSAQFFKTCLYLKMAIEEGLTPRVEKAQPRKLKI